MSPSRKKLKLYTKFGQEIQVQKENLAERERKLVEAKDKIVNSGALL